MNRTQARCEAFKLIFEIQTQTEGLNEIIERYKTNNNEGDNKQFNYIMNAVVGTFEHLERIDEIIEKSLVEGWKINRLSRVSSAILRLAVYEMLYVEYVSHKVAINQAVELAKEFDADTAPAFINGVLGGVHNYIDTNV